MPAEVLADYPDRGPAAPPVEPPAGTTTPAPADVTPCTKGKIKASGLTEAQEKYVADVIENNSETLPVFYTDEATKRRALEARKRPGFTDSMRLTELHQKTVDFEVARIVREELDRLPAVLIIDIPGDGQLSLRTREQASNWLVTVTGRQLPGVKVAHASLIDWLIQKARPYI